MSLTTLSEIRLLVQDTMETLGMGHVTCSVEWNNRFTSKMGDALWQRKRIRLSEPLWPLASVQERRETVIHETCHIVVGIRLGAKGGHGPEWKRAMRIMGLKPERCHNVDRPESMRRRVARTTAYCACKTWDITVTRATKMRRGSRYFCPSCKGALTLAEGRF